MACASDGDCTVPETANCDLGAYVCRQCTLDAHCTDVTATGYDAGLAFCLQSGGGTCVACAAHEDCTADGLPNC